MRIASLAVCSVFLVAGVWVLYTFPPATTPFYPRCTFRQLSGFDCPGCGITRALHALLHGRIGEAFRLNAMLFPLMGLALLGAPSFLRGRTPSFMMHRWFGWATLVVVTAWWIGRNVYLPL